MSTQQPDRRHQTDQMATTDAEAGSSRTGVDHSLIDWMLSLSPAERLEVAQDWVSMVDTFDGVDRAD